jgi:hypothetical protein
MKFKKIVYVILVSIAAAVFSTVPHGLRTEKG